MEEQSYLLRQSAAFASSTLARISSSHMFETLEHTKQVVRAARVIGRASKLTGDPLNTVMIAAWFHAVGYVDRGVRHQERSASIAVKMLTTWGADSKIIEDVSRCVRAINLPQNPKDILSMVLCDAVVAQLASPGEGMRASWLRSEQGASPDCKLESQHVWHQQNIEFLNVHRYFTEYGREILDRRKKANLSKMTQQLHGRPKAARRNILLVPMWSLGLIQEARQFSPNNDPEESVIESDENKNETELNA